MAWKRPLGCIRWEAPEKVLSAGYTTLVKGFAPRHLVALWEVVDASEADGVREVATDLLKPEDVLVGAQINEAAAAAIEKSYGENWILFSKSENTDRITRSAWIKTYGNDPLELLAIKDMRGRIG